MGALSSFVCLLGTLTIFMVVMLTVAVRIVPEHQRLDVYRLGRYIGERGPGVVMIIPFVDVAVKVDMQDKMNKAQAIQQMFDAIGETTTSVYNDGNVEVNGMVWNAISKQPIAPGTRVRVRKVVLEIESI